jgi:steroid delta-isomerase-like uncharacterized protein
MARRSEFSEPDKPINGGSQMKRTIVVTGICAAILLLGPNVGADNTKVAENWIAAWNSHNVNAVAALFTNDAFYEDVPFGLVSRGTAEISAFAQFFFSVVPDLKLELVNSTLKGGHGTIEWVFSGTDVGIYGTGKKFSVPGVTIIDVDGVKIARNSDYYDLATIQRQLGLLPPGL